ncbi:type IV pilus modification PilV family protein [Sporosarcina cyprini]|uniref:type IV pilus modification PilV family protein n=1 Tax=Sporosarcina cyprini TaxID=2910523 RepID=UPI001EE07F88|nr:type II secretion system protein [Sporosarcina cyprini]MCG3089262.1 type II secretion system GspH family protein [Sporosarcina cyprini]
MKRLRVHNNERGLTLVEILASLVILGIVFVGFMTVFPQMTNFNEKTGSKLETMNLARSKLDEIKDMGIPTKCKGIKDKCVIPDSIEGYQLSIEYTMDPDLKKEGEAAGQVALYQVHIKFFRPGHEENPVSETFGYVRE